MRGCPAPSAFLRRRPDTDCTAAVSRHDIGEAAALGGRVDVGGERSPGRGFEAGGGERELVDGGRGCGGHRGVEVAHGEEQQRGVEVELLEEVVVLAAVVVGQSAGRSRRRERRRTRPSSAAMACSGMARSHASEVRWGEEQEREVAPQPARVGGKRPLKGGELRGWNMEERVHQGRAV